jgi:AraC family transcriptional regulator
MRPAPSQVNRFFVHPQYSVQYRRLKRLSWTNQKVYDYGVLLLLNGQLKYEVGSESGRLESGQSLLLQPSVNADARGDAAEFLLLTLASSFVIDHAVRMRLIGPGTTVAFQPKVLEREERLFQLSNSLAAELVEEHAGREIVVAALIEQIVVHLLRHHSNMRRSDELELSRVGLVDRRIRRSVELMQAQLDQDLSLRNIAAASYLSPFHFARLFKKLTGTTPHSYLASLRTTRAQLMLAETDYSVTQISSRVGYSSPSHFSKAFRQATGLTPRAFRNNLVR